MSILLIFALNFNKASFGSPLKDYICVVFGEEAKKLQGSWRWKITTLGSRWYKNKCLQDRRGLSRHQSGSSCKFKDDLKKSKCNKDAVSKQNLEKKDFMNTRLSVRQNWLGDDESCLAMRYECPPTRK